MKQKTLIALLAFTVTACGTLRPIESDPDGIVIETDGLGEKEARKVATEHCAQYGRTPSLREMSSDMTTLSKYGLNYYYFDCKEE